ncbi:MAG: TonB-dependent receptor [Proteobacteria bacterium]|nr:TonB-dependent receptor [Pseudomonadota bacterium]
MICLIIFFIFVEVRSYSNDVSLGTVIVNADNGNYQTGDVSTEDNSSFSSTIKKQSFEYKAQTVSDVVEKESGVQIRQSGGLGSFSSLSLRGASSNQVMVFIDGIPMNEASGGSVDLSTIPMSEIDSIEIYKGITPVNFGTASIGGAVNIKTKRAEEGVKGSVTTSYASFNTFRFAPYINNKPGKFDYVIDVDYQSSKNNFDFLNNNGTKWNSTDDKWEKMNNDQFSQINLLTNAGYDFTKKTRLSFSNQYFEKGQNLPSWNNSPDVNTSLDTLRNISNLKMTINDIGAGHLNTASRIDYTYKKEIYDNRNGGIGLGKQYNRYKTYYYGFNQFIEWPKEQNVLTTVFDIHREDYKTEDLLTLQPISPSSRNIYSLSSEDKVILFDNKFVISPALVFEYYDNNFMSSTSPKNNSVGYLNPKLGIKYSPTNWLGLKTNVARYVRAPSFFELFGDRGFFTGNSDLKAEKGINFDIGPEINYKPYASCLDRLSLNIAYFRSAVTDVISYIYNSRGVGQAVNISNSTINGIETGFVLEFLKNISFTTNYTWQSAINDSVIQAFNGKKLPGRFEHSVSTKLEGGYRIFKLYYELIYASGLYYDSANLLPAAIKREHNIGITFFIDKFTITGEIKNIGDDHYEDFNGFPQPGRSYWLTAKFDY